MISAATAEHYTWGEGCDGWHLVKSSGLSVIQECMPAGTHEVEHSHSRSRQFFFVLAGSLKIEVSDRLESLTTHQGLEIAPGLPHRVFNDSGADAHFLVISQPPSHGDRVYSDGPRRITSER